MAVRARNLAAHDKYKSHQRQDRPRQVWSADGWLHVPLDTPVTAAERLLTDLFAGDSTGQTG